MHANTHARTRAHTQVQEHPMGKTNSAGTPVCPQRTPGDGLKEEHLGNGLQRHKSERLKWGDTPSLSMKMTDPTSEPLVSLGPKTLTSALCPEAPLQEAW